MQSFAQHLKCIGVDSESREALQVELRRHEAITAYTCALGTMQTTNLTALDSGCVWGRRLTAIKLQRRGHPRTRVKCR